MWTPVRWLCAIVVLMGIGMAVRVSERQSLAQTAPAQASNPVPVGVQPNATAEPGAPALATGQQPAVVDHGPDADPKKRRVAEESASLLKLANSLKSEMDKTTVDNLSISVIRRADEIEKLAHKMRSE